MKILKKYKKLTFIITLVLSIFITLLGGGKLLIYLMLLVTGFIGGRVFYTVKSLYTDYRLGLRMNSLQYSAKQYESMQTQTRQLTEDLTRANEQLKLYRSTSSRSGGNHNYDHLTANGLRNDSEIN